MQLTVVTISLLVLCCVQRAPPASAFPTGAPAGACDTLSPDPDRHGALPTPCPEPCPFDMVAFGQNGSSITQYRCGATHTIVILSSDLTPFRGFLTQSRQTTQSPFFSANDPFIGSFVIIPDSSVQILPCDGLSASATHIDNDDKTSVFLRWTAPPASAEPEIIPSVTFWLTIVQVRTLYHVQIPALVLTADISSCLLPELGFLTPSITVPESAGLAQVCVELVGEQALAEPVTATVVSIGGTATAGEDYVVFDGTVSFPAQSEPRDVVCLNISIVVDDDRENDETIELLLTSQDTNVDPEASATTVIIEEGVIVGFQRASYTVQEGLTIPVCVEIFSGTANVVLRMEILSVPSTASINDFDLTTRAVSFSVGSQIGDSRCIDIVTLPDAIDEADEVLFVVVVAVEEDPPFDIDVARAVIPVTIVGSSVAALVGFEVSDGLEVAEDVDLIFVCVEVISDVTPQQEAQVAVTSIDDSAVSASTGIDPPDYLQVDAVITIPSGSQSGTSYCISVSIVDDEVLENTERFFLSLRSLSPGIVNVVDGRDVESVFILDNEPRVSLFGLVDDEVEVREGSDPTVTVCVEMLSPGPLLQTAFLRVVGQNGSALENLDFDDASSLIIFLPGNRRGNTVCGRIAILNDDIAEVTETFTIILTSQNQNVAAIINTRSTLTVSIVDDDVLYVGFQAPTLDVDENDGEGFVCVEVVDTSPLFSDLRVRIATSDGTAIAMQDYLMQQTELIFPPGTEVGDVQCLGVPILDNNRPDEMRVFSVNLASFQPLVRVVPGRSSKNVSIVDNDGSQVEFRMESLQVVEGEDTVAVCVLLLGNQLSADGQVRVTTESGTALAGNDFEAVNAIIEFPAVSEGGDSRCILVTILDDNIAEAEQSFSLQLTSLTPNVFTVADNGGLSTVVIFDNEDTGLPLITFEMSELIVSEDVAEPVMVCIRLSGVDFLQQAATVTISTQPGSADAGSDFIPFSVSITLPVNTPNDTRSCTVLNIVDDSELEQREYVSISIDNITPDVVTVLEGQDELIVRILDDDSPMAVVGFQVIESTIDESVANKFTCVEILSGGPLVFDAVIQFYTQDGTAVAPADYDSLTTTLTFRAGTDGSRPSEAACVNVAIIDDSETESTESLTFNIAAVDVDRIRVEEGRSQKILFIEDNDGIQVGFEWTSYSVLEIIGDTDLGLLVCVTVEDAPFPFSLITTPQDGSAEEFFDYRVNNAPLLFAEAGGNQTQCAYVQIVNDEIPEGRDTFVLILTSQSSSVVVNPFSASAEISILDVDDDAVCDPPCQNGGFCIALDTCICPPGFTGEQCQTSVCDPPCQNGGSCTAPDTCDCTGTGFTGDQCQTQDLVLRFINDSPRVMENNMAADFVVGDSIQALICTLAQLPPQDCSSGSVEFNDLPPNRRVPLTLTVTGLSALGNVSIQRSFRLDSIDDCAAHLINDGVTVVGGTVRVEWQGTGPSTIQFTCILDSEPPIPCTSTCAGFTASVLAPGDHLLIIRPINVPQCRREIGLRVPFQVSDNDIL